MKSKNSVNSVNHVNSVNLVHSVNHVNSVNSISSVNSGNSVSSVSAVLPPFLMYFLQALILRTTRADAESWGESVVQIKHFEENGFCLESKKARTVPLSQCITNPWNAFLESFIKIRADPCRLKILDKIEC